MFLGFKSSQVEKYSQVSGYTQPEILTTHDYRLLLVTNDNLTYGKVWSTLGEKKC